MSAHVASSLPVFPVTDPLAPPDPPDPPDPPALPAPPDPPTPPDPLALPWVRVGAYAIATDPELGILLCRIAAGYPEAGKWTLPGGGVDHGEHPDAGVVREVAEETGLVARVGAVASIQSGLIARPQSRPGPLHWVAILYHVDLDPGDLRQEVGGSTEVCAWHALDAIRGLARVSLVDRAIDALTERRGAG